MGLPVPPDTGPPDVVSTAAEWILWIMATAVLTCLILAPAPKPIEPHLEGYTPQQRTELAEIDRVVGLDRKRRTV